MPDIKKVIKNPDTPSPRRVDRELDLQDWNEEQGRRQAEAVQSSHGSTICLAPGVRPIGSDSLLRE